MNINLSPDIKEIVRISQSHARRLGHSFIAPEHLLLALLQESNSDILDILNYMNVNPANICEMIVSKMSVGTPDSVDDGDLPLFRSTERILRFVELEAKDAGDKNMNLTHLFLAILREEGTVARDVLDQNKLYYTKVKAYIEKKKGHENPLDSMLDDEDDEDDSPFAQGGSNRGQSAMRPNAPQPNNTNVNSDTPVLDSFGIDMTKAAEEGKLDPVIGREKEIERISQILSRRKKNNPILIGEPGVGKSAIVEGLALRIKDHIVPRVLFDKRIFSLDLASVVAGTKYRGQFEERIKAILNELTHNPNIILFIDEIHTIVGAGGATGSLDAANMLKPALARGQIQCIGATTLDEYRQVIEKDGALERRFQKVIVTPTTAEETIQILNNIKEKYEAHHNVTYTPEAIRACVTLTERYISDRHLPDKAIDALDEAGSRVHITNIVVPNEIVELENRIEDIRNKKKMAVQDQNFELAASFRDKEKFHCSELAELKQHWQESLVNQREIVDEDMVAHVVAMMTGVPVQRIAQAEGERLLKMNDELKGSVVGQDEAIQKVVKAILRNRAGLKNPNRPIGSFIFMGPTGVGKTLLAQVLAKYLFDSTDALIRVDMSEYMEKFAVSRLVGAPPGYVGYEEGGQLTEKVRRKPYSVVLLDEIEKAHPDVFNILLQVLDEGMLTDSLGRKVDFKNTIIIMTSNVGSRELKEFGRGVGFAQELRESDDDRARGILQKALKKAFAPEFINRIDDIITFKELKKDDIFNIIDIELRGLYKRISELGFTLTLTDEAKNYIADKSYDSQYGARPLRRSIQRYVEDVLAELIIEAKLSQPGTIVLDYDKETDKMVTRTTNQ